MSSEIVEAYRRYYESPTSGREQLLKAIIDFNDFEHFDEVMETCYSLFASSEIWHGDHLTLATNGSMTGVRTKYNFSSGWWIEEIEAVLRNCRSDSCVAIYDRPYIRRSSSHIVDHRGCPAVMASLDDEAQVDEAIHYIEKQPKPVTLLTTPNVWLHITTNDELLDKFNSVSHKITQGVNTDWELWARCDRLMFPVRDQMVDWRTGLNFYVCPSGQRHFLPIFYHRHGRAANLLNLCSHEMIDCDDLFKTGAVTRCACGKTRMEIEFVPHLKHNPSIDRNVLSQLNGRYQYIQFVQEDATIHVYTDARHDPDMFLLKNMFFNQGFCVEHHPRQFIQTGGKVYNFWKSTLCKPRSFYTQERIKASKTLKML